MAGDEPFDRLARLAAHVLDVPASLVTIVEEDRPATEVHLRLLLERVGRA